MYLIKKETEEILKYKGITIEIQHMWNAKTKMIPVITGGTDITNRFRKYLGHILETHKIKNCRHQPHWQLHIRGLFKKYRTFGRQKYN
jgi:hypothetical protein